MKPTAYVVTMSDTPAHEYFITSPQQLGMPEQIGWKIHHRAPDITDRFLHIRWPQSIFNTAEEALAALEDYNNYCKASKAGEDLTLWKTSWEERRTR